MTNSLYFLIFYSFTEGIVFLAAMYRVRNFNEDFNLLNELKRYAIFWLFFNNLRFNNATFEFGTITEVHVFL